MVTHSRSRAQVTLPFGRLSVQATVATRSETNQLSIRPGLRRLNGHKLHSLPTIDVHYLQARNAPNPSLHLPFSRPADVAIVLPSTQAKCGRPLLSPHALKHQRRLWSIDCSLPFLLTTLSVTHSSLNGSMRPFFKSLPDLRLVCHIDWKFIT